MAIEMYKGMNLTGTPSWHGTRDEYDNLAIHDPNTMYFIEDETGSCILWKGTREMFNNLPAEYKNDNTLYVITDESIQSEDISYDNSTSGLSATNIQDAIDEVVSEMGGGTASDITYDNTTSGLVATDVQDAIDEVNTKVNTLPKPMQYKGTLGTGGTIQTLPVASDENYGHVYKVITAGTYSSQTSKVGDMFISNGTEWTYIPSGDDANSFADLTDTNISSPSTGQLPMYDATTGMWKNEDYIKEVTYATWQSMTPEQKANGKYIVSDYPTVTTAPIIDNQSTSENVWSGQKINTELGNKVSTNNYSGSTLKTSVSKTGSGSTVTNTINSNTSMDAAIGTLLNNDYAISNNLTNYSNVSYYEQDGVQIRKYFDFLIVRFGTSATFQADGKTITTITNADFIPGGDFNIASVIYNGSVYVDCRFMFNHTGEILVTDLFQNAIPNAQFRFLGNSLIVIPKKY